MASFLDKPLHEVVPPGVLNGEDVMKLLAYAKAKGFAMPAFNCTSSSTVNAVLEGRTANPNHLLWFNGPFFSTKFSCSRGENPGHDPVLTRRKCFLWRQGARKQRPNRLYCWRCGRRAARACYGRILWRSR